MFLRDSDRDPLTEHLLRYSLGKWHVLLAAMSRTTRNEYGALPLSDIVENIDNVLEEDGLLNGRKKFRKNDILG